MKVADLIEKLQEFGPEDDVVFAYDYGDRCHVTVAKEITDVDERVLAYSSYHDMEQVLDEDEEDDARCHDARNAVVIW